MKSATVDAIRKLEAIIEVYDEVPDGWFTMSQYCDAMGMGRSGGDKRLSQAVNAGRAERKQIRLARRKPCWIYRAKTQIHTTEARRAPARPRR